MTGGNWNRLWGGPPLSRDVRSAIAEQAVRWVLVPALLVGAFAAVLVFATVGLSEPTRFVPLLVFAAPCLWIYRLKRARRWLAAAAVLSGAVTLTVVTAVLLNSVHAPAYWLGLMVLSLIVPLFRMRWGIATALLLLAAGACWLALDAAELTTGVRYAAATTTYGLYAGFLLIALCLLSGPHLLVADALNEAQRKRKEAEAARIAEAASELAFHAVFDQASVAMVLLTSNGTIAQLNHRALSLLGSSGHLLVGRELSTAALWTEPQRRLLRDAVERAAAGKRSHQDLTLPSNDSGQRVFHLTVSPYHTAQGTVEHVHGPPLSRAPSPLFQEALCTSRSSRHASNSVAPEPAGNGFTYTLHTRSDSAVVRQLRSQPPYRVNLTGDAAPARWQESSATSRRGQVSQREHEGRLLFSA